MDFNLKIQSSSFCFSFKMLLSNFAIKHTFLRLQINPVDKMLLCSFNHLSDHAIKLF